MDEVWEWQTKGGWSRQREKWLLFRERDWEMFCILQYSCNVLPCEISLLFNVPTAPLCLLHSGDRACFTPIIFFTRHSVNRLICEAMATLAIQRGLLVCSLFKGYIYCITPNSNKSVHRTELFLYPDICKEFTVWEIDHIRTHSKTEWQTFIYFASNMSSTEA